MKIHGDAAACVNFVKWNRQHRKSRNGKENSAEKYVKRKRLMKMKYNIYIYIYMETRRIMCSFFLQPKIKCLKTCLEHFKVSESTEKQKYTNR